MEEIAAELRAIRRFPREIELVVDGAVELGHDLARLQPSAVGPELLDHQCARLHQRQVFFDRVGDVRAQHLDRCRRPVGKRRQMHLSDRGTRHRRPIERTKHAFHRLAVDALQGRDHLLAGKRRNAVLQAGKLVGDVGWQDIATRGEHLSELDEDRSQLLQCEPQALRAWRGQVAPEGGRPRSRPQPVKPLVTE